MDESLVERLITTRTKAIVPVHYAGVGCEMDTILSLAKKAPDRSRRRQCARSFSAATEGSFWAHLAPWRP